MDDRTELHLGRVDPEAPSAGPIVATDAARAVAVFPLCDGFDAVWLPADAPIGTDDVTWIFGGRIEIRPTSCGAGFNPRAIGAPSRRRGGVLPPRLD